MRLGPLIVMWHKNIPEEASQWGEQPEYIHAVTANVSWNSMHSKKFYRLLIPGLQATEGLHYHSKSSSAISQKLLEDHH